MIYVCVCVESDLNCVFNDDCWDETVSMETVMYSICSSLHLSDCRKMQCPTDTGNNTTTVNIADTTASDTGAGCGYPLTLGSVV